MAGDLVDNLEGGIWFILKVMSEYNGTLVLNVANMIVFFSKVKYSHKIK